MSVPNVKFNPKDKPEFFRELSKRVNRYFKENNISKHANWNMKIKTVFMLSLYFVPLSMMYVGALDTSSSVLLMWVLMGFGMAGIGASVMHDANHGSYSKRKYVNKILGYTLDFLGGYHVTWKIQHNVLHHSYTNVDGHDEDIDTALMRFSPNQERKKYYRFQSFYAPFLYGLMSLYWYVSKDYEQISRYHKRKLLAQQGLSLRSALIHSIAAKVVYTLITIILPIVFLPIAWYWTIVGFLIMHFICGLMLALIFQPAHVIQETEFFEPDSEGSVENNWAIHQMRTTSNFGNSNYVLSWLIGGLNYQIEHHLFPHICHVHYRKLSKIVKATAEEYGVPYYQHRSFASAIASHFRLLHELGTGKYDKKASLAKA